jgi:hypothetical protein
MTGHRAGRESWVDKLMNKETLRSNFRFMRYLGVFVLYPTVSLIAPLLVF